jgi:hypothetical protein
MSVRSGATFRTPLRTYSTLILPLLVGGVPADAEYKNYLGAVKTGGFGEGLREGYRSSICRVEGYAAPQHVVVLEIYVFLIDSRDVRSPGSVRSSGLSCFFKR